MKRNIQPEPFKLLVPKPPKRTKEQKVVCKALDHISRAMYSTDKRTMATNLNYACGLLEALIFQDDKENEE